MNNSRFHSFGRPRAVAFALVALLATSTGSSWAETPAPEQPSARMQSPASLPGAEPYPTELATRIAAEVEAKGKDYQPRTHHLLPDSSAVYTNRLIFEDSPYLIQHAHNPVNWRPWGPEAFETAKREDKPIFLSIGYSTCHWCHVMERESFEDEAIAKILNEKFVCIKIDRERRPDIDDIYMTAIHLQRNRGGWPMSSFLTQEGKPFYGGTYFPPEQFTQLLARVEEVWNTQRTEILASADRLAEGVREVTAARGEAEQIGQDAIDQAVVQIVGRHDKNLGGFGAAPKFPHETELLFLLGRLARAGSPEAAPHKETLDAVVNSLDAMARGGIYDQVGGGFHRYSTDAKWLVPHFEKMLYNQAHLSRAYLEAHRLTGNAFFGRVARQTLDYVLKEMTAPGGGFYSATDADSEGEEGLFFIWTPDELRKALSAEDAKLAMGLFAVNDAGNFEGHNILHLPIGFEAYAAKTGMKLDVLLHRIDQIRETLWQDREKRIHPIRDDKILTAWNGMMITALASGHEILGDPRYLEAARKSADFLWEKNHHGPGALWRVHLDGRSSIPALQDDYAYFSEALVALYDQTGEEVWLTRAREVTAGMLELFWDNTSGGFFMSAKDGDPHLIARPKSPNDGAIPSGNSVAVRALARLAARTGERLYTDRANASLAAFSSQLRQSPSGYSYMLLGADEFLNKEVGPRQYVAEGTVQAMARLTGTAGGTTGGDSIRVDVDVRVQKGWHINAHKPLQKELIPTLLEVDDTSGWRLSETEYPSGERVKLGFQEDPLLVYEGTVRLSGTLSLNEDSRNEDSRDSSSILPLRLKVQACDDEICLRPEVIELEVSTKLIHPSPVGAQ